jgi:hypothetical protein
MGLPGCYFPVLGLAKQKLGDNMVRQSHIPRSQMVHVETRRVYKTGGYNHMRTWRNQRFVVVRNKRGSIITSAKYSSKVKLAGYHSIYKKNGTFNANLRRTVLTNVVEYEYRYTPEQVPGRIRTQGKVQYAITAKDGGHRIYARSRIEPANTNKKKLRQEAYDVLYNRLSGEVGGYDVDRGRAYFDEHNVHIVSEGLVWYAPRGRYHGEVA